MNPSNDEFLPTQQSLLNRLKNLDDQRSWQTFFERYWRLIYSVARRAGLGDAEAQDVVQETVISVSKKIHGFTYDPNQGSFKGWLKRLTQWRIADYARRKQYQFKGQRYDKEEPLGTSLAEVLQDPVARDVEGAWDEEWRKNLVDAAFLVLKDTITPLTLQIFQLHVVKQYPAKQVAEQLGVKLTEIYAAKYKVSALLKKEVERLAAQWK
jgi:RNA polymerase sigma factor (sigma-70 family)